MSGWLGAIDSSPCLPICCCCLFWRICALCGVCEGGVLWKVVLVVRGKAGPDCPVGIAGVCVCVLLPRAPSHLCVFPEASAARFFSFSRCKNAIRTSPPFRCFQYSVLWPDSLRTEKKNNNRFRTGSSKCTFILTDVPGRNKSVAASVAQNVPNGVEPNEQQQQPVYSEVVETGKCGADLCKYSTTIATRVKMRTWVGRPAPLALRSDVR